MVFIASSIACFGNQKKPYVRLKKHHTKTKQVKSIDVKSTDHIPIIAFVGVPQYQATLERYQEMRAAGITDSYCPFSDAAAMEKALDMAQKAGLRLFVSCPELYTSPQATAKRFMNHPALAGYYINDEPGSKVFLEIALLVKKIRAIDDKHVCYVNLLPNYAVNSQLGAASYQDYVSTFIKEVPVQQLSFDNYPIMGNSTKAMRGGWYQNLEIISQSAKSVDKPFWAFALSVAFSPYPVATLASLRLQVYSDLAYGAQGIQYFTYWTLSDKTMNFNNAPMTADGKKTDTYGKIQQISKEINNLSGIFLGAQMVSVAHTGNSIPVGTKPLTQLPKPITLFKTKGVGAVVSVMKKNGTSYLVVVNRDFTAPMGLIIKCANGVSKVSKDGSSVKQSSSIKPVIVGPGDVAIYEWPSSLD